MNEKTKSDLAWIAGITTGVLLVAAVNWMLDRPKSTK